MARVRPSIALVASLAALAIFAAACGGGDGSVDEELPAPSASEAENPLVQAPGSKSAEDEQARLAARLPGRLTEARIYHTSTRLDDGRVLVTGGRGRSGAGGGYTTPPGDTAEIFDPEAGDWTVIDPMPSAREYHRAVLLKDGHVLVTGGAGLVSNPISTLLFDPDSGTWIQSGDMNSGRFSHTATVLPDGRVLVAGGKIAFYLEGAELYDPSSREWSETGTLNGKKAWHRATLLNDGRVLVTGGKRAGIAALNEVEIFDPSQGTWETVSPMATARQSHTANILPDGRVLVVGGYGQDKDPVNASEIFDPASGTWTDAGTLTEARADHTATTLENGDVIVAGGLGEFSVAEMFQFASGTWVGAGNMNLARYHHTAELMPDGSVMITGGFEGGQDGRRSDSVEVYYPDTGEWLTVGPSTYEDDVEVTQP